MALSSEDIRLIVQTLQASEWDQAEVTVGDVRIAVARNGALLDAAPAAALTANGTASHGAQPNSTVGHRDAQAPAPAPAVAPAPVSPAPAPNGTASHGAQPNSTVGHRDAPAVEGHTVTAPSVGVFWRAPEPGAAPFVKVGSVVAVGDTIGIVEVMKLMSNIATDVAGTVVAIHTENAEGVQFGTPLVTIRPEA